MSRVKRYLDQAQDAGMADRVVVLGGDAESAIALADVVLTAYSTGGIDAVVRQRPVICVTHGEVSYPVDLPAMLGVPLARSAQELTVLLGAFRRDPAPLVEQARAFIRRETQFIDGPGDRLRSFVDEVIRRGAAGVRQPADLPDWLFLDGPHPVYAV